MKWHVKLTPEDSDCFSGWKTIDYLAQGSESYDLVGSKPQRTDMVANPQICIG